MKRIIMTISLIVFASLFVFGVIFTGGQGSSGSIVSSVQAADDDDDDYCRTNCSVHSLKGCFGFTINGTILGGPFPGPLVGVALTKFDGEGGFTQVGTVSINGTLITPLTGRSETGTYTVNPDCTGSAVINPLPGQPPIHYNFVLVDRGREIRTVVTNPGAAITSIGKKQ